MLHAPFTCGLSVGRWERQLESGLRWGNGLEGTSAWPLHRPGAHAPLPCSKEVPCEDGKREKESSTPSSSLAL